jgi:alpha-mannosidase
LYEQVFKTGEKCLEDALHALGFEDYNSSSAEPFAINTLSWNRREMVELPATATGPVYAIARSGILVEATDSPPQNNRTANVSEIRHNVFQLSNTRFDVDVSDGVITSIYDKKARREVVAKGGKANQLVIFDDKPLYWQAWDVELYHIESRKELHPSKTYIAESGPHRVSVVVETQISEESWVKSTISLEADVGDAEKIDIQCEVEWRETMKFLKVEFPVDIVNTEASYDTQFGINRRPTHYNTSWDMAKFEVCCHKWADLSEAGYGVSILNDSKYGFATCGNLMRLSLLRAPKAPDGHADMGKRLLSFP